MIRVRGDLEPLRLERQQIVFLHDSHHPFVVHLHSSAAQLHGDASIPVTPAMLQGDLLDDRSHLGFFFDRSLLFQRSIETAATDRNQLAHALDAQAALQKHYFSDLLEDPVSPVSPLFWRRASTFCKAPLKKSTSRVFSASSRLSCWFSFRLAAACVLGRAASSPGSSASSFARHL